MPESLPTSTSRPAPERALANALRMMPSSALRPVSGAPPVPAPWWVSRRGESFPRNPEAAARGDCPGLFYCPRSRRAAQRRYPHSRRSRPHRRRARSRRAGSTRDRPSAIRYAIRRPRKSETVPNARLAKSAVRFGRPADRPRRLRASEHRGAVTGPAASVRIVGQVLLQDPSDVPARTLGAWLEARRDGFDRCGGVGEFCGQSLR